jgi:hypothetical protein
MTFKFIESLGIGELNLSILGRGTQRKNILLYQHEGAFQIDNIKAGNTNDATGQYNAFFRKAAQTNADLVLTPEYSCPWSTVNFLIDNNISPSEGKLWAIGCESISKEELRVLSFPEGRANLIFDRSVLDLPLNYLNPLLYLFTTRVDGTNRLTAVIQFKTHHMSAWNGADIERNNLILGETIYVFRNSPNSTHLFSMICSDAMSFSNEFTQAKQDSINWHDMPFLILNPQLNPNPIHATFTTFRKVISSVNKKQIITLNWNNKSTFNGRPIMENKSSRSGIYIRTPEANVADERVKYNHERGLYYFYFSLDKHSYIINSAIDGILLSNSPVDIMNPVPLQNRHDGPQVQEIFVWNDEKTALENVHNLIPDGHLAYLGEIECTNEFLTDATNCILEKEKLVSLTTGNVEPSFGKLWHNTPNLFSVKSIEDTEINRRITFVEDNVQANVDQRTAYITAIAELENDILPDKSLFPDSISHLRRMENIKIGYYLTAKQDDYRYNTLTSDGEKLVATICYLGQVPPELIDKTFDKIQGLFNKDNNNRSCVVVFYKKGVSIHAKSDPNAGKFTMVNDNSGPSFFK